MAMAACVFALLTLFAQTTMAQYGGSSYQYLQPYYGSSYYPGSYYGSQGHYPQSSYYNYGYGQQRSYGSDGSNLLSALFQSPARPASGGGGGGPLSGMIAFAGGQSRDTLDILPTLAHPAFSAPSTQDNMPFFQTLGLPKPS